mmetsp:Transcript_3894/g.5105  ORF Transcript_3894/g.5105 Transcript_3894/m.5105 type:complete len:273 (+) Transcript_3894:36-854(+)
MTNKQQTKLWLATLLLRFLEFTPCKAFQSSPIRINNSLQLHRQRGHHHQEQQQQQQRQFVCPKFSPLRNTILFSSPASDSGSISRDDDDNFMKALKSRIDKVSDRDTKLPIVVVDAMLPRQTLKIEVGPDDQLFHKLIKSIIQDERPYFGMVGAARLANSGQTLPLQNGVKVQLVGNPIVVKENHSLRVELKALERFRITGELDTVHDGSGWTEARVKFLDSAQEEAAEEGGDNPISLARAMSRVREFTSPNLQMPNGMSLIDRWVELAKKK